MQPIHPQLPYGTDVEKKAILKSRWAMYYLVLLVPHHLAVEGTPFGQENLVL